MLWKTRLALLLFYCGGSCSWAREDRQQQQKNSASTGAPARADTQRAHAAEVLDFGYVPSVVYETHAYYEPGPIGLLFHMVHALLYAVQPNPFPKDLIVKLLQQNMGGIKPEELQKAIYYEIGFIVLAVLGFLFLILMPLVGFFFCMCRCCENCGGEMHQRHRKNADCQRGFYTASLIASSIFITAGVLVAYTANHNITTQIKSTRRLVSTNIRDLKSFANYTPAQIDYLTAQYTTAKNKVLSDLDNIGPLLGGRIHNQLEKEVVPALDNALRMTGAMRETKEALENVSTSLETLQDGTGKLQRSLQAERSSLSNTLNDPACSNGDVAHTCSTIRGTLSQLAISANFNGLPDVSPQLANLETVMKTDLSYIVQKVHLSVSLSCATGVKALLDKSGAEIIGFTKMFPVEPALENFTKFLSDGQKNIEAYYPQIDQLDFYRWIGCVVVCCMVVLILAFNILGLMCGSCGYDKNATPTTRGCMSNTGGNLLMAGVGFSFIFSWVLMGIVVTSFVAGGNTEKLVCEPLANRQLFKVHIKNKVDCYENNGIYAALKLENKFNFVKFINATAYNPELASILERVNVDLQGVTLLEPEGKDNLINFANTGLGEINYPGYLTEVNKGVTVVDLLSFANELEAQADNLPRGALGNALKGHASSIRQIHKEQVLPMEQAMVITQTSLAQCKPISNIIDSLEIIGCSFIIDSVNTFWFGLGGCCLFLIPSIIMSVKLAKFYRRMDTEDVFDE
uniref:Prominin-1-A-like n=1 Tax=Astyanax mexicanus TaxID=7994 RepID=A0A8B9M2M1_ASTMX